jgi:hypothetical protein
MTLMRARGFNRFKWISQTYFLPLQLPPLPEARLIQRAERLSRTRNMLVRVFRRLGGRRFLSSVNRSSWYPCPTPARSEPTRTVSAGCQLRGLTRGFSSLVSIGAVVAHDLINALNNADRRGKEYFPSRGA